MAQPYEPLLVVGIDMARYGDMETPCISHLEAHGASGIMRSNWTGRKTRVHPRRGKVPATMMTGASPVIICIGGEMSELSIFIDESGDVGSNSSFYLVSLVLHDQSTDISGQLSRLERALRDLGWSPDQALHTGPMVRKEDEYQNVELKMRRKLFDHLLTFTRTCDIRFKTFCVDKREYPDQMKIQNRLARELSMFMRDNMEYFTEFDRAIAYYDNGQAMITSLVNTVFGAVFFDVEFRKVRPNEYRLFQSADLFCTLDLIRTKIDKPVRLTRSEEIFFESKRRLKKDYLKTIDRLRF